MAVPIFLAVMIAPAFKMARRELTKPTLSRREREVAALVAEGLTDREIAQRLFVSERTADAHLEHIRKKLGVHTRAQVATWVARADVAGAAAPAEKAAAPRRTGWPISRSGWWVAAGVLVALVAGTLVEQRLTAVPEPTIETVAGSQCPTQIPPGGCFADDVKATNGGLARPNDVAVGPDGAVYIADGSNRRVRLVTGGNISTFVGGGAEPMVDGAYRASVQLGFGSRIAIDGLNRLYVLTCVGGSLEVWRVERPGGFLKRIVRVAVCLGGPGQSLPAGGIVAAKDGALFIADRAANQVWEFDGTGLSRYAGTGERGHLGDGGSAESAQLNWPVGLALDKLANLYIADAGNNRIRKVDHMKRSISTVAGSGDLEGNSGDGGSATAALLSFPFGVAIGAGGMVVIADTGNHRLRAINSSGTINALAGTGRWGFSGDNLTAIRAQLSGPEAVAFDSQGNLFVADTENQRVREISGLPR